VAARREDVLNSLSQIARNFRTRLGKSEYGGKALNAARRGYDSENRFEVLKSENSPPCRPFELQHVCP
jgi:hypothetical protein